MPAKILALGAQAGLVLLAWWMTQPESERRAIQAKAWKELEKVSMNIARRSSNLAAYSERKYRETVTV